MPQRITRAFAYGLAIAALGTSVPAWGQGATERVSLGPNGVQGDGPSEDTALSADGRFVAFASYASTLVPGDTNGGSDNEPDAFVHDRQTGRTTRVSVGPNGRQSNNGSYQPALSADGRFVAFYSWASTLVPGDTNSQLDVFVHDRQTGRTTRVSVGPNGRQSNSSSYQPALSADGRFVAFASEASNLVPGDTSGQPDVFVHDRQTGRTTRVSVGPNGRQSNNGSYQPALSAGGRFVAFTSLASNLVPGDTNDMFDVFVHDRRTGTTQRVSLGPNSVQGNNSSDDPALSPDGRVVAFTSSASNLVPGDTNDTGDVFVHDRRTGITQRISLGPNGVQGNAESASPALSAGGRVVAFTSSASNLVPGDTNDTGDVFVHDRRTGITQRISLGPNSVQGNAESVSPALSAGGRVVAFTSSASNLVPGDTNGQPDVFVRTLVGGR